jgi:hypothetical protein
MLHPHQVVKGKTLHQQMEDQTIKKEIQILVKMDKDKMEVQPTMEMGLQTTKAAMKAVILTDLLQAQWLLALVKGMVNPEKIKN